MKKLFIAAMAAGLTVTASARTLSADEALDRVLGDAPNQALAKSINTTGIRLVGADANQAYYVFASDSQTLFVSGDDQAEALLGYTDTPLVSLDAANPELKWWLSQYARQIEHARQSGVTRSVSDGARRVGAKTAARHNIAALVKTNWDQGAPYNNQCPKLNNKTTYTGCVATAMAQVMYYYKWPAAGTGTASYYWTNGRKTLTSSLTSTLDWDNMLLTYATATSGTTTQRNAVATLMKMCGYACQMDYGGDSQGGSAAMTPDMVNALINNFNYDKGMRYEYRDYYTAEQWDEMMYNNLVEYGPILYGGTGSEGGHQFICDGYRTDGYYHMNWGWNGDSDGYFLLNALNPSSLGAGGGAGGFNYQQDAVLAIQKPVSGSTLQKAYLSIEGTLTASVSGRTVTLTAGSGDYDGFANMSQNSGVFTIGVRITDPNGKDSYTTIYTNQTIDALNMFTSMSFTLASGLANGKYTVTPVYKLSGDTSWTPFRYYLESGKQSVVVEVNGSTVTVAKDPGSDSTANIYVTVDVTLPNFPTGQTTTITPTVNNGGTTDLSVTIVPVLCTYDDSYIYPAYQGEPVIVDVEAESYTHPVMSIAVPSDATLGEYYLAFLDKNMSEILNQKDVYVNVTKGSSVSDIIVSDADNGPVRLYNMQGQPVTNPRPGQIVIRRTANGQATKQLTK